MLSNWKPRTLGIALSCLVLLFSVGVFFANRASSQTELGEDEKNAPIPAGDIRKPEEPEGYAPKPEPDQPLPPDVKAETPGQPPPERPRPSREELEKLAVPPVIPPDSLFQYSLELDYVGSASLFHLASEAIVIADVVKIEPARWSTTDGKRPVNPYDFKDPHHIYTLINVKVERTLKGKVQAGEVLTLGQNGGQVGEEWFKEIDEFHFDYAEGQKVILYIDSIQLYGKPAWRVNDRYTIDPTTNEATTPKEKRTLDELIAEVVQAKPKK